LYVVTNVSDESATSIFRRYIPPINIYKITLHYGLQGHRPHFNRRKNVKFPKLTKLLGRVVSIPASYSGGPGFKTRPRDRLSWQRGFKVFLSPFPQMVA
jgi:hypothetical protein